MNPGGRRCSEPRLRHCTPAWESHRVRLHLILKNKQTKSLTLITKKAPKLTSPNCTFLSCLPSDVGSERQSLGSAEEEGSWDVEGGAVEQCEGGSTALWLPVGSMAGIRSGSGTEGRTSGNQQQWGQDCTTLTVCTKGLAQEAGKHSQ